MPEIRWFYGDWQTVSWSEAAEWIVWCRHYMFIRDQLRQDRAINQWHLRDTTVSEVEEHERMAV